LTDGPKDRPARHRALRAALDWSHDLLLPYEQILFRRLGVFVGGCAVEAATAACELDNGPGIVVLDGLTALTEHSLLQADTEPNGEPRFRMLESIREYAWERLVASTDFGPVRQRHARVFLTLAEAAEAPLRGPRQTAWRDRLQREMPNLGPRCVGR
jgi:predicted ATPase